MNNETPTPSTERTLDPSQANDLAHYLYFAESASARAASDIRAGNLMRAHDELSKAIIDLEAAIELKNGPDV